MEEAGKERKYEELREYMEEQGKNESALIAILHKAQEIFGYLPEEVQLYIARQLEIPASKIYGVVTFYSYFTMKPRGRYQVSVCLGTACFVRGSDKIYEELKHQLGIQEGEVTENGLFSLHSVRCVGACGAGAGDHGQRKGARADDGTGRGGRIGGNTGPKRWKKTRERRGRKMKIGSQKALMEYYQKVKEAAPRPAYEIMVGMATCGIASGAQEVWDVLAEEIKKNSVKGVELKKTGCIGYCYAEPVVEVKNAAGESVIYSGVTTKMASDIVKKHLVKGQPLEEGTMQAEMGRISLVGEDEPVTGKQMRIALRDIGKIDPEKIDDYIKEGGYQALAKCLFEKEAGGSGGGSQKERVARPWGRRLSDRGKVGSGSQTAGPGETHHLQRGRRGPGRLYGPEPIGRRS